MPARLKSLELFGYKTFAARTSFEFASTVTAIVGPNGSGKSNIADSIRWVLGEQSYSLLRGKKTEDMIFAGSEQRPRASMASVSIVFDNSDSWLPIDFAEVAITRRAYRDGENEYLLNGQRVRLKDVSELLAQSGLAERTYTIIGQGLVDAALALKAEERRRLFEEAAGIGLHRARREEALRRLETINRNLDRVQDILAELLPRLRSLERQARRTQEYEQVKADLRILLRDWYGYHWHTAQKDLVGAREIAHQHEDALDKARQAQAEIDQKLTVSREIIQSLRLRLGCWHRESAQLHSQGETISKELAVMNERERASAEQEKNTIEELGRLEEELGFQKDQLIQAQTELAQRKAEQDEARIEADNARRALATRQAERVDVERKVSAARQALSALTARQAHLQARHNECQLQSNRQVESLQTASRAVTAAEKEMQTAEARLKSLESTFKESQAARQASDQTLQDQRKHLAEFETVRKDVLDHRSESAAETARLKAQLEVIEQAESNLAGYASGARLLIQAARQSRLKGARGALSSFLEVPAELEVAVASALGDYVDAVLFEHGNSYEEALSLLEGKAARAVLLPLDDMTRHEAPAALSAAGRMGGDVIGLAADLIHVPDDLRPVVDLLLGEVWIVKNRDAARRLVQHLRGENSYSVGSKVVTLRGEVFYTSGPIQAGQEGKPGTLGRPRQRRELVQNLERLQGRTKELEDQLRGIDRSRLELMAEIERLSQQAQKARKLEDLANAAFNQQDLAVEKQRRQLQWQRDQRTRTEEDMQRGKLEIAQITGDLSVLEQDITRAREASRNLNSILSGLSLDEQQTRLAHWNTRLSLSERALVDSNARHKERGAALERAEHTHSVLNKRLEEIRLGREKLEKDKQALHQQETQISSQIETLKIEIEPAELELDSAERDQAALQMIETEKRQALSGNEHHHAQAKINLAKRQETLDSLQRRIEEDFGLVAFEYTEQTSGPTPLPLEGMVEQLPFIRELSPEIEENIKRQRGQLRRIGPINPEAQQEYKEVKERYEFLTSQVADSNKAQEDIKQVIVELDMLMQREFRKTFDAVSHEFRQIFTRLFGGGSARLVLTDPEDMTDTGIDIEARLPGRRTQGLSLLSGGERSLTATSLVFALLKVSPTPFCLLDEVDAMLDEANVGRFRELLRELSQNTQFIVVTHNRNTVQAADVIYGITMGVDSSSQILSLKLDEISKVVD
jgi:chromosome segregation protein